MIKRELVETVVRSFAPGFITMIYGPRRVGKTVLLEQIAEKLKKEKVIWFNGDTQEARGSLSSTSQTELSRLIANKDVVFIDEAQRIENIALSLKIIVDTFPEKKIIVTGSSSLSLTRGMRETLTGRMNRFRLFPLSVREIEEISLSDQLIYGGYPYLVNLNTDNEKRDYLKKIVSDYLFTDLMFLKDVNSPETIKKLAALLAFQVGSEVSLNELSRNLGIDVKTVRRYITLLVETFVIFELPSFSRNLRKELAKSKKYYFWDLGIRNAVIDQFLPLDSRLDLGALWENFLAVERIKMHEYKGVRKNYYFWRTYEKAEIDWIEAEGNNIAAYEFKWKSEKLTKAPVSFKQMYGKEAKIVTKNNYLDFANRI